MRTVLHMAGARPCRQLFRAAGINRPENGVQQITLQPALVHQLADLFRAQHALLPALLARAGRRADRFQILLQIRHQRGRRAIIHKHLHPRGLGRRRCRVVIRRRRQSGQIHIGRAHHLARVQMRATRERVVKSRLDGRIRFGEIGHVVQLGIQGQNQRVLRRRRDGFLRGPGVNQLLIDVSQRSDITRPLAGGRNVRRVGLGEDKRALKTGALADDFSFHSAIWC